MAPRMEWNGHPFGLRSLADAEEGGWLVSFPDFPGCMADGETPEQAMAEARDARCTVMAVYRDAGRPLRKPGDGAPGGNSIVRPPKSAHAKHVAKAQQEGVSMHQPATVYPA